MVKEAKQPKREHPCPLSALPHQEFQSPSDRDRHARAVHEKKPHETRKG